MKRLLLITAVIVTGNMLLAQMRYGNTVIISQPVYEDLYIAGGTVIINAPVHGDLVIAGGTININDTVTNDILVAGGNITFNGFAGDDIRCAGGSLHIAKNIAGDLVVTGGTILIDEGVTIGGLIAGGGDVTINGTVTGNVKTASGKLVVNGVLQRKLDCKSSDVTINGTVQGPATIAANNTIVIGSTAAFMGDVRYWSPMRRVNFGQSLKGGTASFDPSLRFREEQWYFLGFASVIAMLWYVSMVFLLIMIVQYLFRMIMRKAGETVYLSTLRSFGYGLLFWVGVPVAAVITCITVIGVPVGLILIAGYVVLLLLANVITSVVAANWFTRRATNPPGYWKLVFIAFAVFIMLKIISFTPFLGRALWIILACIAFGAIVQNIHLPRRKSLTVMNG